MGRERVWFAQPLLSSATGEIRPLIVQAKDWAERLGCRVRMWMSDKQSAFVKTIASVYPGVPHRYCSNHFLRDLAKPVMELDSHAKVQMRSKIRGLRGIERAELQSRATRDAAKDEEQGVSPMLPLEVPGMGVVLDYCAAVRGILNDSQGGPLRPPGLQMSEALGEVQQSLQCYVRLKKKRGDAELLLDRLIDCIDKGKNLVVETQQQIALYVEKIRQVDKALDPASDGWAQRKRLNGVLERELLADDDSICQQMGRVMASFKPGLFAGGGRADWPRDNLDLERWFRLPKGHERRIHGRCHAGVRLVQEGATMLLALDAHRHHPQPFTEEELRPYRHATIPENQTEAIRRRKVMKTARSTTKRRGLLRNLEERYAASPNVEEGDCFFRETGEKLEESSPCFGFLTDWHDFNPSDTIPLNIDP